MSLSGLDSDNVRGAYDAAIADPAGWFLLKYATRAEVEILQQGTGGFVETREAIAQYGEPSPLFGLILYRKKKVMFKYVPEDTSRLLQARLFVHFQGVIEAFAHDALISITTPQELTETALSSSVSLLKSSNSTRSTNGRPHKPLSEILEDGIESTINKQVSASKQSPANKAVATQEEAAEFEGIKEEKVQAIARPPRTTSLRDIESTNETDCPSTAVPTRRAQAEERLENRPSVDGNRPVTQLSSINPIDAYVPYTYKPKVKLGPRPVADPTQATRKSGSYTRPVSTLPAGVSMPPRKPVFFDRPSTQQAASKPFFPDNGHVVEMPSAVSMMAPLSERPGSSHGSVVTVPVYSHYPEPRSPTFPEISSEKQRLMKALQQRKRHQLARKAIQEPQSDEKATVNNTNDVTNPSTEFKHHTDVRVEPKTSDTPTIRDSAVEQEDRALSISAANIDTHDNADSVKSKEAQIQDSTNVCDHVKQEGNLSPGLNSSTEHFNQRYSSIEQEQEPGSQPRYAATGNSEPSMGTVPASHANEVKEIEVQEEQNSGEDSRSANAHEASDGTNKQTLEVNGVTASQTKEESDMGPSLKYENDADEPLQNGDSDIKVHEETPPQQGLPSQDANLPKQPDTNTVESANEENPAKTVFPSSTEEELLTDAAASPRRVQSIQTEEAGHTNLISRVTPLVNGSGTSRFNSSRDDDEKPGPQVSGKSEPSPTSSNLTQRNPHDGISKTEPVFSQTQYNEKKKRPEPIEAPKFDSSDAASLSGDSFMEELSSATVEEAKPMTVSKSPATPVFPVSLSRRSSENSRLGRTVSSPLNGEAPPMPNISPEMKKTMSNNSPTKVSVASVSARSVSSPIDALPMMPPDQKVPRRPAGRFSSRAPSISPSPDRSIAERPSSKKAGGVSSLISSRIKALEKLSKTNSPQNATTAVITPSFVSSRKTSLTTPPSSAGTDMARKHERGPYPTPSPSPHNFVMRTFGSRKAPTPSAEPQSKKKTQVVAHTTPIPQEPKIPILQRSQTSETSLGSSVASSLPSVQVQPPQEASSSFFPLSSRKSKSKKGSVSSISSAVLETLASPSRNSFSRRRSTTSRKSSSETVRPPTSPYSPMSSDGKSKGDGEKKESKKARLLRRMSSMSFSPRKTTAISPTLNDQPIVEDQEPSSKKWVPMVLGDVNVQFPDTLLWKRRHLEIDTHGYLILAPSRFESSTRIATKRYHVSEFRQPYVPDQDREELPYSVILDFHDSSTLQCSCQHTQGQLEVLKVLLDAHSSFNSAERR